jgi:hypothetical protein
MAQEHATRAAIRKEAQRQRVRAKVSWEREMGDGERVKDARVQRCSKIPHSLALLFQLVIYLDYVSHFTRIVYLFNPCANFWCSQFSETPKNRATL